MIKQDAIASSKSCLNTAYDQEHLFILLARDPAAPAAIRAWITERLRLGRNKPGDEQIREAYECATLMELQRGEITSERSSRNPQFSISRLTSIRDMRPTHEVLTWPELITLLSKPRRSPCTTATCSGTPCPHKQGPCWSPASFTSRSSVEAIYLLVFDVDHTTNDQVTAVHQLLKHYQYLVHSTHSDHSSRRSLRFVLPLSRPLTWEAWTSFHHTARLLLAPSADPACADARRFYFLPSCPHDATYFFQVNEGAPLDVDALLATISPGAVAPSTVLGVESQVTP